MTTLNLLYLLGAVISTIISLPSAVVSAITAFQYFKVKKIAAAQGKKLTVHMVARKVVGLPHDIGE